MFSSSELNIKMIFAWLWLVNAVVAEWKLSLVDPAAYVTFETFALLICLIYVTLNLLVSFMHQKLFG